MKSLKLKTAILLTLLIATTNLSNSQCIYKICLTDDYGDGWDGNTIDVFVNGAFEANYTSLSGLIPECYNISVNTGDDIDIIFNATGSWTSECNFYLYSNIDSLVGQGNDSLDILDIIVVCYCGVTSVISYPPVSLSCEGNMDTINFVKTGSCSGNYEFQILDGTTIVQAWSNTSYYITSPPISTIYTVEARCDSCPGIVASDTFLIDVIDAPTITGNLTISSGTSTTLTASGSTGEFEWWTDYIGGTLLDTTPTYVTPNLFTTTTYWVQANGMFGTESKILITECSLENMTSSNEYIEISNPYENTINTSGWVVAISDSYSNINTINPVYWYLPSIFPPCSVDSRTDNDTLPNYWGNNMFWNPSSNSWAIIIDDNGNVIDFVAWGWNAAELATFNPTINGFSIILGTEWTGDGCNDNCGTINSIQRIGNLDNNMLTDFVCQTSTIDTINFGLPCGWISGGCRFPVTVAVNTGFLVNSIFENQVVIYPNPTNGKIRVEAEGIEKIEVLNLQGKQIYTGKATEIDLSTQPKGIYIIKVTTNKGVVVEKVILE